ncbi:MAG: LPP20 family lipoprotein [Campylobacterales bacterium]|nr:LPP20 family lipoprotein [Campylobacterales bacterium]
MKKTLILAGVVAASLVMTGCSKKEEAKPQPDFRCKQKGTLAPEWTCKPYKSGMIVGLGTAPKNIADDYGMQMEEAEANGRTSLARRLETKVKTMFKNWKRVTGAGTNQTYEKNIESVSKQSANQTLRNSRALETWQNPTDGTLFLLMGVDKGAAEKGVKTSLRNEQALWQQFQSKKAMKELDKEMDKEFSK